MDDIERLAKIDDGIATAWQILTDLLRLRDQFDPQPNQKTLLEFFQFVCNAPPLLEHDSRRWRGIEWKLIQRNEISTLADYWKHVSELCQDADWARVLDADKSIIRIDFESQSHGNKTVVRFVGRKSNGDRLYNSELTPPK